MRPAAIVLRRARALRRRLSGFRPPAPLQGGPALLEAQYRRGEWDYLAGDLELPRFGVVAAFCHRFADGGRLLELGCGEGLLAERLDPARYSQFVGVDIAETPIRRARERGRTNARFIAADAATYEPPHAFDAIVFNEVLEYFEDPPALLRRYGNWLAPDGVFIVSQFNGVSTMRTARIWRTLDAIHPPLLTAGVSTSPELAWTVKVYRPGASVPVR